MLCAYRRQYGMGHVLVKPIHSWKRDLVEVKCVRTVLIDLSEALHCIPHGLYIVKMKAYGLSNHAYEFMTSYLSERYQRVKISNEKSYWMLILKAIPQGSSLCPVLLNVFMHDVFYSTESCSLTNYIETKHVI